MAIEEQRLLQEHVKAHQATLGCEELKRLRRLVREAGALMGRLTERAAKFSRVDPDQFQRSIDALQNAARRAERRDNAYYGA